MKRWKKWLVNTLKLKGTLDTERVLREKNRRILELEQKVAELQSRLWYPKLVHVEIDQAGQKAAQSQIGTYDLPERTTDKPKVIPSPHGRYFQEQRKSFEKTHLLPTFKRLQDEPPFTSMEMTQVRIPTWIL